MPTLRAMFRILFVTCLFMRKALLFQINTWFGHAVRRTMSYILSNNNYNQNCLFSHLLHVEQFCISTVYIIRMSFSALNNFIIVVTVVVPHVCECLFVVFWRHLHLDPDVRVHRGTENPFIYYNRDFC